MKTALIGVGRWGQILLKELEPQAEIKYRCDSKTDLNSVFADPEIEAVFVATPISTHFDIAKRTLESGKHLFLEKPGTSHCGDLENLCNLARKKNLRFAVGYEFPHHPAAKRLKQFLANKKIVALRFEWLKWGTFKEDVILNLLSHEISLIKFWTSGEVKLISCKKTPIISFADILETEFTLANESSVVSLINRVSPIKQKTVTLITEDSGYVWNGNELYEIKKSDQVLQPIDIPTEISTVKEEISDFLSAIEEGREPLIDGSFALKVFQTVESVR